LVFQLNHTPILTID